MSFKQACEGMYTTWQDLDEYVRLHRHIFPDGTYMVYTTWHNMGGGLAGDTLYEGKEEGEAEKAWTNALNGIFPN